MKSLQAPSVSRGEVSTMRAAGEYTGFVPDMQRLGGWPGVGVGLLKPLGPMPLGEIATVNHKMIFLSPKISL